MAKTQAAETVSALTGTGDAMLDGAFATEKVPIKSLRQDPDNARIHSTTNIKAIADSLLQFGQRKPIVALADGTVIAGNGTLEAARKLKWANLVVVRFDDEKLARAFAIADNRTAELAEWDDAQLKSTLRELAAIEVDISGLGFDGDELQALMAEPHSTDFLNGIIGDGSDDPEDAGPTRDGGRNRTFVDFAVALTPDDRAYVHKVLREAKQRENVSTTSEALLAVCRHYAEQ